MSWFEINDARISLTARAFCVSSLCCPNLVQAEKTQSIAHVRNKTKMKKQMKPDVFFDHYLTTVGLWRKPVPRDGLSLFRAVSEQLFKTQVFHTNLYEACRIVFLQLGKDPEKDWTESEVISILSRMYKREFFIYENVGQPPLQATNNHYQYSILLCRISDNQLDSVYPYNYQESLAICQSVLYELLYREVFGLDQELTDAVNLIRDQNKHKQTFMSNKLDEISQSYIKRFHDISLSPRDRLRKAAPPVPYRIAKALDPRIYRNVELDIWEEDRREQIKESPEYKERFSLGDKCQVILEGVHYHGLLQEISDSDNTVVVFIHELGEKRSVPIRFLKSPHRNRDCHYVHTKSHIRRKQDWLIQDICNKRTRFYDQSGQFIGDNIHYPTSIHNNQLTTTPGGEVMSNVNCDYVGMDITSVHNINNIRNQYNQPPPFGAIQRYPPPGYIQQTPHQQQQQQHSDSYNTLVPTSNISCPRFHVPYFDPITLKDVNMNCYPSQDVAGQDLPEVNTLRFFYNLGVENFRTMNQGGVWTGSEMIQMMPPGGVFTQDHINGNLAGQFVVPPPNFTQYPNRPEMYNEQSETQMNQSYCLVPYQKVTNNVSPVGSHGNCSNDSVVTSSSSPTKSQSDSSHCDESIESNDSGCDSDSGNSVKELETDINTEDLERKLDHYIAKVDIDSESNHSVNVTEQHEFQVPTKPKAKKKYYMYGNLRLVKPIKDIPPKFLSKLSELSIEKARCEGEPIIIPFLPPKPYRGKIHRNNYNYQHETTACSSSSDGNGTATQNKPGFNPEAKCFVPSDSVMHDPSVVAYSSQTSVQYVPYNMYNNNTDNQVTGDSNGNTNLYSQQYIPTYIPNNTPGAGMTQTNSNLTRLPANTMSSTSNMYSTNSGDGIKCSMIPISTGQQHFQMYPTSYQPVYYPTAVNGTYQDASNNYYPSMGMAMTQGAYQGQYCSVQPQVNNAMQAS